MNLSILIPSRNEEFLAKTIENILENIEDETEIIAGMDGDWANPPITDNPKVILVHYSTSIGQRAMTNQLCRLAKGKYVMKIDAHCAFDKGFDRKMIEAFKEVGDDVTMIPTMRNLHAFDWVCKNGHKRYQGPSGDCKECGEPTKKEVKWIGKQNPQSNAYKFDKTMHFQYDNGFGKTQEGDLTETMSIQGSCFMLTREKFWELDISSEAYNSWGQQGVEVACKTWLSGGRVIVNRRTWYAHMFRTQGKDFGFPYENPQSKVDENRELSRKMFELDGWKGAKRPFSWLLKKFNPPEWELKKGILYYTDNRLNMKLATKVRNQLKKSGLPITSVSLKPIKDFGHNIHFKGERGQLTKFKQILTGLEQMTEDYVFFCVHDCLYPKEHFDFTPERHDTFYYNSNVWRVRDSDGFGIYYDHQSTSGLCGYRKLLIEEYKERVRRVEKEGYDRHMGYEPGTRSTKVGGFSDHKAVRWQSKVPYLDIRHEGNLTRSVWKKEDFKRQPKEWVEGYDIPGWGRYNASK